MGPPPAAGEEKIGKFMIAFSEKNFACGIKKKFIFRFFMIGNAVMFCLSFLLVQSQSTSKYYHGFITNVPFLCFIVIMKAVGGEIGSASALAPKLGPLGLVS